MIKNLKSLHLIKISVNYLKSWSDIFNEKVYAASFPIFIDEKKFLKDDIPTKAQSHIKFSIVAVDYVYVAKKLIISNHNL